MREWPKRVKRLQLALMFSGIVFAIILTTMFIVFIGLVVLRDLGYDFLDEITSVPVANFALASLFIGTVLSLLASRRTLQPIRTVAEAADKIAGSDYSTRIHLHGPDELVQLGESFNHMAEELSSVEMLRTDFVNNFSHEFKTPIVSMSGFAEILKREDLSSEERNEYLDIIISESNRLTKLASNVLLLSEVENQTILTDIETVNITEQIRKNVALLEHRWREKNLMIDFDSDEIFVEGNSELLNHIWINLLDNAIKFSPDHEIISIAVTLSEENVIVSFTDHGPGITPEGQKHIFDRFYQEDRSHSTQGSGLGLSLVKKIVTLHGGTVRAENTGWTGATFFVVLPEYRK